MQFNEVQESVAERTASENYEGGPSYDPDSAEMGLVKNVLNNLLEDSFYESDEESFDSLRSAFEQCASTNPEFVLKMAKYARQEEGLRDVPQVLLVLAANDERTREYVRDYAPSIMDRADEPLTALAVQVKLFGKSIPNSLQGGIEDALHQFNEYQFAKYDRPSREFQYRDLLNLVHPKPRDDTRESIFRSIAYGELDDHEEVQPLTQDNTWEDAQSSAGEDEDVDSAEVWREQLREGEDGYSMPIFARVRNVRNMLDDGLTGAEIFGDECGPAVTDEWVRNSKMLPFRFYQAYKALREAGHRDRDALDWLENAMTVSAENVPDAFENSLTVVDTSGSMTRTGISEQSDLTPMEIGALFGAVMAERDSDVAAFASSYEDLNLDPRDTVMTNMEEIANAGPGGGTHGHLVPETLFNEQREYDSVIIFTDMQMWGGNFRGAWNKYKSVSPDTSLYVVDLASYGDLVTPEGGYDVYNISGWSTNVLDFIASMERVGEMVAEIEEVEA
jgi:60 kDa SS-A/Ro ribonucleoprotein